MSIRHDLRQGVRGLRKNPSFALGSILVLALGIGATTAIFSLVDAAFLRPLRFQDAHQLVMLWSRSASNDRELTSMLDFVDWKEQNRTFSGVAAAVGVGGGQTSLSDDTGGVPEAVELRDVTGRFFDVLAVKPLLGRTFVADDDRDPKLVMSERLWRTRFGADPGIVGRSIRTGSPARSRIVIGVVPASVQMFGTTDLWVNLPISRADAARGQGTLRVIARLQPGLGVAQAQADMNGVAANIERISAATNAGRGVTVEPLRDAIVGDDLRSTSLLLGGVVVFVLLLACANVANLSLARGIGRVREVAVRSALGASPWRVARQLLTESAILGVIGGIVGLAVASALLELAPSLIPARTLPEPIALTMDWRVAAFAIGLSLLTALLFGLAPIWQAVRVPLSHVMQATGGRGSSDGAGRVRQGLVVVEIAAALLLVTGAGLLVRTLSSLDSVDAGYRAANVVTMSIKVPFRKLVTAKPGELAAYWRSIEEAVASVPGVGAVSLGSDVPLNGNPTRQPFEIIGATPPPDPANRPLAQYQTISPRYLSVLGIPVVRGRGFTEQDSPDSPPVAIVNEEFVRRHFPGRDPIGERIVVQNPLTFRSPPITREIVGVVPQVKTKPDEPAENALQVYVPLAQNNLLSPLLVVRTGEEPQRLLPRIKAAIARVDPTQAVAAVRTMDAVAAEATARPRFRAQLVTAFAALATSLAAVGVLSMLLFTVHQRAREFAVRVAMGATAGKVMWLVFNNALKLTTAGVVLGLGAAALLAQTLQALLFGVRPMDAVTFLTAPALLMLVAIIACLPPALRALRSDAAAVLKSN